MINCDSYLFLEEPSAVSEAPLLLEEEAVTDDSDTGPFSNRSNIRFSLLTLVILNLFYYF